MGKSSFTDKIGITDKGLNYGAYRIVSGPDTLVMHYELVAEPASGAKVVSEQVPRGEEV